MADMTAHPVWFKSDDGQWSQINNVIAIVVASPLVPRGTYRDEPPATPGAGSIATGAYGTNAESQIVGGVTPAAANNLVVGAVYQSTLISPSSIAQDDEYAHEPLRYVFGPEPVIFFQTADPNSPALPTNTTFSTDRPAVPTKAAPSSGGHFPIFNGDCFFPWTKNCGLTNTPPQGWIVFDPGT